MKNTIIRFLLILAFLLYCLLLQSQEYLASDLGWSCIGRDSFMINLTAYSDCNSSTPPSTRYAYIQCTTGSIFDTVQLDASTPVDVTPVCPSSCTRCSSSCSFPYGIQKWEYTGLLVIPGSVTCCEIKAGVTLGVRSSGISTGAAGQGFYTYAVFNRCQSICDNSPTFTENPALILCTGLDWVYNSGLIDIDASGTGGKLDSFSYEFSCPMISATAYTSYISGYGCYNWLYFWGFPNSSLPFPLGFHIDPMTGDICVRPIKIESTISTIKINEYRNGLKIGEVRREFYTNIINCPGNHPPALGPALYYKEVCAGSDVTFTINTNDLDPDDTLSISWNHSIPGAAWTDNNGLSKHPTGIFYWQTSVSQASMVPYNFIVTVKDDACPVSQTYTHNYQVLVKPKASADISISDSCGGLYFLEAKNIVVSGPTIKWSGDSMPEKFTYYGQKVSHRFSSPGIYPFEMTITSNKCCSTTFTDTVEVDTFFYTRLPADTHVCIGSQLNIWAQSFNSQGRVRYKWNTSSNDTLDHITLIITANIKIKVNATDSSGCTVFDSINVYADPLPQADAGNDKIICLGDSVMLHATGGNSYQWSTGQNVPEIYVKPHGTDTFVVDVGNNYNCHLTDTVIVYVNPLPVCKVSDDTSVCFGQVARLTATGGLHYLWSTGNNTPEIKFMPISSGFIYATATDFNSCRATDSVYVTVYPLPHAYAGKDTTICSGNSVILHGSGGVTYHWSTGDSTADLLLKPSATQNYWLIVTDTNSCVNSAMVRVGVIPSPVAEAGKDTAVCLGDTVVLSAGGGRHYQWSTGDTIAVIQFVSYASAYFVVRVRDTNICVSADSVYVTVHPLPAADAGPDQNACEGRITTLTATGGSYYRWSTGDTNAVIHFIPLSDGYYYVNVKNQYGCESDDSVYVTIRPVPESGFMAYPLSGIVPLNVMFFDTSGIDNGKIMQYQWDFGDSCISASRFPQHTYTLPGTYDVSLVS